MRVPGDRPQDEIEQRARQARRRASGEAPLAVAQGWPWRTGLKPPSRRLSLEPERVRRLAELTSPAFATSVGKRTVLNTIARGSNGHNL